MLAIPPHSIPNPVKKPKQLHVTSATQSLCPFAFSLFKRWYILLYICHVHALYMQPTCNTYVEYLYLNLMRHVVFVWDIYNILHCSIAIYCIAILRYRRCMEYMEVLILHEHYAHNTIHIQACVCNIYFIICAVLLPCST